MKQTAVEWLVNELYEKFEMKGDGILFDEFLKQAKEMEKQQIIDAHLDGQSFSIAIEEIDYAEQYYNETFKE
jgi:hypothetical protein